MADLEYTVTNQGISTSKTSRLVSGTIGVYTVKFTFNNVWDGLEKWATFDPIPGTPYKQPLDANGECTIPGEVMGGVYLRIGVFGLAEGQAYPTIWASKLPLEEGCFVNVPPSDWPEPSPLLEDVVKVSEQTFTDAQKTQARTNIGAAGSADMATALAGKVDKPVGATEGNVAIIGSNNNIEDSGLPLTTQLVRNSDAKTAKDATDAITDIKKPKNKYTGQVTVGGGYVNPSTGTIGSNSAYTYTDYIDISGNTSGYIVLSGYLQLNNYAVRYALYDSAKTYKTGAGPLGTFSVDSITGRYYLKIATASDIAYIRFSASNGVFTTENYLQIEFGEIMTTYAPYFADKTIIKNTVLSADTNITMLGNMTYGVTPIQKKQATLTGGSRMTVETNSVMKNQKIVFSAKIGTLVELLVGHGYETYGYYIAVTPSNMIYCSNSVHGTSIPHGLTIEDFIIVIIEVDVALNIKVTIVTKGGSFTRTQQINSSWRGAVFAQMEGAGSSVSDAVLTWWSDDYKSPVWAFGDSYFTLYSQSRWTYYVANAWGFDTMLLNGYPGASSAGAYKDLVANLQHGTPKYLLWCLGMNDPDTTEVNATWYWVAKNVEELCHEKGIELIYATIPNVTNPSYNNTYKNQYIYNSGYRYVDFASAVSGVDGWLSDDGVHPSVIGGRLLAVTALQECPELLQMP